MGGGEKAEPKAVSFAAYLTEGQERALALGGTTSATRAVGPVGTGFLRVGVSWCGCGGEPEEHNGGSETPVLR